MPKQCMEPDGCTGCEFSAGEDCLYFEGKEVQSENGSICATCPYVGDYAISCDNCPENAANLRLLEEMDTRAKVKAEQADAMQKLHARIEENIKAAETFLMLENLEAVNKHLGLAKAAERLMDLRNKFAV